jgi:hypothetical protein
MCAAVCITNPERYAEETRGLLALPQWANLNSLYPMISRAWGGWIDLQEAG